MHTFMFCIESGCTSLVYLLFSVDSRNFAYLHAFCHSCWVESGHGSNTFGLAESRIKHLGPVLALQSILLLFGVCSRHNIDTRPTHIIWWWWWWWWHIVTRTKKPLTNFLLLCLRENLAGIQLNMKCLVTDFTVSCLVSEASTDWADWMIRQKWRWLAKQCSRE